MSWVRLAGREIPLVHATDPAELADALQAAGLPPDRPVVVLVGGAGGLSGADGTGWQAMIDQGLVAAVRRAGASTVDGGTDSGVMALAGAARARAGGGYPAVGVVAGGTIRWPGGPPGPAADSDPAGDADRAELGPGHSHFVVVDGARWGDESPWIPRVARALAGSAPSVTVLVNGCPIAMEDVRNSLADGRPVIVVRGTGRLADELAAGAGGRLADISGSPLLRVVDGLARPELLADAIGAALARPAPA